MQKHLRPAEDLDIAHRLVDFPFTVTQGHIFDLGILHGVGLMHMIQCRMDRVFRHIGAENEVRQLEGRPLEDNPGRLVV